MSWVITAVVGIGAVTVAAQADASRKQANAQKDALNAAQAADTAQKAQAETGANQALIAAKQRRRAQQGLLATDATQAPMGGSVLGSAADSTKSIQPVGRSTLGGM